MKNWGRKAIVALVVLVPYGGMAILFGDKAQESHRIMKQVEKFVSGTCDAWADVALIYGPQRNGKTVPYPKTTGPTLFKLQADFRKAYVTHGCNDSDGVLPKADPRLFPYLSKDLR